MPVLLINSGVIRVDINDQTPDILESLLAGELMDQEGSVTNEALDSLKCVTAQELGCTTDDSTKSCEGVAGLKLIEKIVQRICLSLDD